LGPYLPLFIFNRKSQAGTGAGALVDHTHLRKGFDQGPHSGCPEGAEKSHLRTRSHLSV
jgi:hypothetical protein